jgi:NitT/TauT family transport system substrate-binding protein
MKELARLHGFDSASVQITNLAFPMRWPMLASGDVDFIAAWWGSGSTVISQSAKKQNIAIDIVRWSEFGLDIYGEVFVARRDWVESNKDLVHRVLSNLERAYVSCKENPEPCVGAVLDSGAMAVPDRELVMQGWLESSELLGSKRGERGLLGIDPERLTRSARAIGISIADLKRQAYISFAP